jgi:hypothetical protein
MKGMLPITFALSLMPQEAGTDAIALGHPKGRLHCASLHRDPGTLG